MDHLDDLATKNIANLQNLVGGDWNMNFMTFHILGISSYQLTNIFQRGRLKPPTRLLSVEHGHRNRGFSH